MLAPGERLDRLHDGGVRLHGEHAARDGDAVDAHGAAAADAVLAADVRAREPEPVAQEVGEQQPRLDVSRRPRPLTVSSTWSRALPGAQRARSTRTR